MSESGLTRDGLMQGVGAATGKVAYQVLTRLSEVEAIAADWEALLEHSSCNRAFSSATWYLAACRSHPGTSPLVVVARQGADLSGILPLAKRREDAGLTFPTELADYNDIIAVRDDPVVAAGLLTHVLSHVGGHERLVLSNIRPDSTCARALSLVAPAASAGQALDNHDICPHIRLPASHAEYVQTRSRRLQTKLRRVKHRARRDHLRVEEWEPTPLRASQLPDAFLSLHLSRHPTGVLAAETAQSFVRAALPRLFGERKLRAFVVHEDHRMVAIHLCVLGVDSLGYWNGGFLAESRRWSPGTLLTEAGIEASYALGLAEYDFLRGCEDYKLEWATDVRHTCRIELEPRAREWQ